MNSPRMLPGIVVSGLIIGCILPAFGGTTPLTSREVANSLDFPLFATAPPEDYERLFIVERAGRIRILDLRTVTVLPSPFLDISPQVSTFLEQGLLGMAFHPDYATNGHFYLNYTNLAGDTVVARYTVSADPDIADVSSGTVILTIDQPEANHNGGMLTFGPLDGYLYIGTGDGGLPFDGGPGAPPEGNAQSGQRLLGKILRIDVDGGTPYAIPPDNPFVGDPTHLDEIWAKGLRNPWRFSLDRLNSDIYIGDVGEADREEVDYFPGGGPEGENYGWRCLEGTVCTGFGGCDCADPDIVLPVHEYETGPQGCSVIGGYAYRGVAMPDMQGVYYFTDWCSSQIYSFVMVGGVLTDFQNRTAELDPPAGSINGVVSFGEDAAGEIYLVSSSGRVFKILPADFENHDCNDNYIVDSAEIVVGFSADCNSNGIPDSCDIANGTSEDSDGDGIPDECQVDVEFVRGDCNVDSVVDISDAIFLLSFLFGSQSTVDCGDACDGNDDGGVDISDVIYLLDYLFAGSPGLPPFPDCGLDPSPDGLACAAFGACP